MKSNKLTIEQIKEKIKKIHGDNVILDESSYTNTQHKARFIDKEYGEWMASPCKIMGGQSQPTRGMLKRIKSQTMSIEKVEEKLKQVHGDNITIDRTTYISCNKKAKFIDKDYGEWWRVVNEIINGGSGHSKRGYQNSIEKQRLSIKEIEKRLFNLHGNDVVIDRKTYISLLKKAKFIDKDYGEWWAYVHNVVDAGQSHPKRGLEKYKQVCQKHFGCNNPQQNREIHLKTIRSSNKHTMKYNWETNEEVDCTASYECAVVDNWNEVKERFRWQIPFENKEENYVYFVDAYLPDRDIYIEIKGYFWDELSQEKWEWFHKEHSNSELWDQKKLKDLGIL
jgi:hypothetical protein